MPFPYVSQSVFERELSFTYEKTELTQGEWDSLLTDKLKQESERVESYTSQKWRNKSEVPRVVKAAVIRLTRSIINQIEEGGLSSESVGDHDESYRPLGAIRAEVRAELADAGYEAPGNSDGPTLTRNSNRTITITPDPTESGQSGGTQQ